MVIGCIEQHAALVCSAVVWIDELSNPAEKIHLPVPVVQFTRCSALTDKLCNTFIV